MIVRVKRRRERPYVVLERATLRMAALSYKARGLWALCMSFPDDWEFRPGHLAGLSERDGEASVRSALKELEAVGLACYEQARQADGTMGRGGWTIYESPALRNETDVDRPMGPKRPDGENRDPARTADSPDGGLPDAAEPDAAEPDAAEPDAAEPDAAEPDAANRRQRSNEQTKQRVNEVKSSSKQRPSATLKRPSAVRRGTARRRGERATPLAEVVSAAERHLAAAASLRADGLPAGASKASHLRPFARPQPEATLEQAAPIAQLVERGVAGPVPRRLVEEYGQAAVVAACAEWDRRRAEGRRVGPGLLVTLVREGVGAGPGEALLSYAEMLAVCDREGITTEAFEAVPQPDGRKPLWRRKVKPVRHEPAGVQG